MLTADVVRVVVVSSMGLMVPWDAPYALVLIASG
jgi:hypothetical protein